MLKHLPPPRFRALIPHPALPAIVVPRPKHLHLHRIAWPSTLIADSPALPHHSREVRLKRLHIVVPPPISFPIPRSQSSAGFRSEVWRGDFRFGFVFWFARGGGGRVGFPFVRLSDVHGEQEAAEAAGGGDEVEDAEPPERQGEEAEEAVCVGEEEENGEEEADEGAEGAEDQEGAHVGFVAVAEGVANEVWMGLVAQGGVEHFLDRGEGGGVGGVFEGAEDGCAVVVGEVELAWGAGGEVVVCDSGDLGAQRLRFGRVPDVLVWSAGFDGRDGEFDVVESLGVLVCEFGDFVTAPGVAVRYVFAHDVDVVGCDHS